ncbi:L-allo-threonine aldolase domain protein [delta proteobacterium NaphS2]|nr:L-allo-threonine aldolase domain protein [delta proteobacterium NaphS2]
MVVLENTHNLCGGSPLAPDYLNGIAVIARGNDLKMHVDGARIFNAATALNVSPAELAAPADSISPDTLCREIRNRVQGYLGRVRAFS